MDKLEDKIKENKIRIETNLRFAANHKNKNIAVFSKFSFESESKPFIIVEAGCYFNIIDEAWENMLNSENNSLTVPLGFIKHLAVITVGTTRGILHTKTEDTCYNKYVLPTINVASIIKDDVVFLFNDEKNDKV